MPLADDNKRPFLDRALGLTAIPTGAGKERRVIEFLERWLGEREDLVRRDDAHGNIEIAFREKPEAGPPVYFTAHMDHPAFVVERVVGPGTLELAFRGGVMDDYFPGARVRVFPGWASGREAEPVEGAITARGDLSEPFKSWLVELEGEAGAVGVGDLAVWALPGAEVVTQPMNGPGTEAGPVLLTPACDDLAALAASLCAMDVLREARAAGEAVQDARLLFTRAEEIGFVGAIGASMDGFMPRESRVIALETSRSFPGDSPIGGGPIVRVGDRLSTFSPSLTAAVSRAAEQLAGRAADATAVEKTDRGGWRWQRKLMAGGACEATVFCAHGYEATCVCLPLGNYHNMARLAEAQAGELGDGEYRIEREYVAIADYFGMVELLAACGRELTGPASIAERLDRLWSERRFVLG